MIVYWNWPAIWAPLISDVVFIGGTLTQAFINTNRARELSVYFGGDLQGNDYPASIIESYREYVARRLAFDGDRVALATTLASVPFALIFLFDLSKPELGFLLVASVVAIVGAMLGLGLLESVLTKEDNRNKLDLLPHVSWIAVGAFVLLVVYTGAVVLFTSPALTK